MKKLILVLTLLLAPIASFLVSCGNNTPTSSNSSNPTNTPTPAPTATNTPTPSVKTIVTFSGAASIMGICLDNSGNLYAADYNGSGATSNLIKVTSAGVTTQLTPQIPAVSDVVYDGTNWYMSTGTTSPYFIYRNSAAVTTSPITATSSISGVAINSAATTMALSSGSAVTLYSLPAFSVLGNITLSSGPSGEECLVFDNTGSLYVAQGNLIVKYTPGVSGSTTIAGQIGAGAYVDGAATTTAKFNGIQAIAVDGSGNVYVADTGNNAIRKVSSATVSTLVGPSGGSVTPAFTSPAIVGPQGIAVDSTGDVYFSDRNNSPGNHIYEYIP